MRVVHVLQSLQLGGLEKMVVHLARGARAHGIDVHVAAYLEDGPLRAELEEGAIPVHVLARRAGLDARRPLELGRLLRRVQATHVHTHHLGPFLYTAPAARVLGLAHVHTEHSHEFYDVARRRLAGRWIERVAVPVACSEEVARYRAHALGARSVVIENGVPAPPPGATRASARATLALDPSAPVVMAVGRLAPEKNHAALLRAFARLSRARPDAHLVLMGDGVCRPDLVALTTDLGLTARVTFTGARADVGALLPAADVLAFSSDREALPLALLEGMAARLPFVGTAVGELPALAADGAGVVVDVGPAREVDEGLAGALGALLSDRARAASLGARGHALWRQRFSVDAMVDRYVSLYRAGAGATAETRTAAA